MAPAFGRRQQLFSSVIVFVVVVEVLVDLVSVSYKLSTHRTPISHMLQIRQTNELSCVELRTGNAHFLAFFSAFTRAIVTFFFWPKGNKERGKEKRWQKQLSVACCLFY